MKTININLELEYSYITSCASGARYHCIIRNTQTEELYCIAEIEEIKEYQDVIIRAINVNTEESRLLKSNIQLLFSGLCIASYNSEYNNSKCCTLVTMQIPIEETEEQNIYNYILDLGREYITADYEYLARKATEHEQEKKQEIYEEYKKNHERYLNYCNIQDTVLASCKCISDNCNSSTYIVERIEEIETEYNRIK